MPTDTITIDSAVEAAESLLPPVQESQDVAVREGEALPAPAQEGSGALLTAIVSLAKDPSVDVAKLGALLGMQERMEAREAERMFGAALGRIQAKAPRIPKNGVVSLGKGKDGKEQSYDFAKWEDMDTIVSPLLREEGFAVTFSEDTSDQNGIRWAATWRAFGHSEKNFITLPPDTGAGRNPLQARGSTNSYAKRYLTEDFLKLVREGADDDGKRGGTVYITPDQVLEIQALALAAEREESRFLETYTDEARSFEEVQAGEQFIRLMRLLSSAERQVRLRKARETAQ